MNLLKAQESLNEHGFPCGTPDGKYGARTRIALQHFQLATTARLFTAGGYDRDTDKAIRWLPKLSEHFTVDEVRSRGNGNCYIKSELLHALEALRDNVGRPVPVASGYRDPAYNRSIPGAATRSLHMWGLAADISSTAVAVTLNEVKDLELFSGIGWVERTGYVRHVDMRHLTGYHVASPLMPSVWSYRT